MRASGDTLLYRDFVREPDESAQRLFVDREVPAAEAAEVLRAELDLVKAAGYPRLRMETASVNETPVRALLDRAHEARMLVVGHGGHKIGSGVSLGLTSRALVEAASCPVVVSRPALVDVTDGARAVARAL